MSRLRTATIASILLGFLVCSGTPAAAQVDTVDADRTAFMTSLLDQEEGLGPAEAIQLESVGAAKISPDGREIAYTVQVPKDPRETNALPSVELHVYDTEAGTSTPFVTGDVRLSGVQWTPSGRAITFLAQREGDEQTVLYQIPRDGGEARVLYRFETGISSYDWAPGGRRLVFTALAPRVEPVNDLPYSPNVYRDNPHHARAYVVAPRTESPDPQRLAVEGTVRQVAWSPAGDRIAVARTPTPYIDDFYMAQRIRIVSAETRQVVETVENPGKLGELSWSPDGERLAFISGADEHDTIDGRLMVADVSSGSFEPILQGYEGKVDDVAWTDAETIRYSASQGVWTILAEIRYDGSDRDLLLDTDGPIVNSFSLASGADRTALVADAPEHPAEAYLLETGEGTPERLTTHNEFLAETELGRQEVVRYEARDGLEIEGLLIRPVGAEEGGGPYPLVTVVHGGPEAHYDMGWLTDYADLGQVAAARGLALFYPNYRGSTGRGVEFATTSQADPAGREFEDIVDGVEALVERGIADPDRVGVTGGSYGGYATAWMATRYTDRFAAGVMFVGISDLVSSWGSSDIPQELHQVHYLEHIWEDWDFYLERSPIYHTDDADTPLLIMEGAEDTRLRPTQSIEMYNYLRFRSDAPVRMVTYPNEGHGNRRSTAEYDYLLRSLRWMEHYLQGPGGEKPAPALTR